MRRRIVMFSYAKAVPPTFIAPAFSALRWAIGFAVAMVGHQPLGWLCLGMYCWRLWQTLMRLNIYLENRVAQEHGGERL